MKVEPDIWAGDELSFWLALDACSGCGLRTTRLAKAFERFGTLKSLWLASHDELRDLGRSYLDSGSSTGLPWINDDFIAKFLPKRAEISPENLLAQLTKSGVQAYPYAHPLYPSALREIHDPPLIIYANGRLSPLELSHCLGVVGTRSPSSYGSKLAKSFAAELGSAGVTIVSGMAVGIDSLAHWGAIESGARTVAIPGCGPDVCYPSSNKPLFARLTDIDNGVIFSEYFPGSKPEKWRFPARNRIISGMSQGLLVIEAGESSGSLITARQAFEQNRQVFAIPGRVDSQMSAGTNRLIANQTAQLVTSAQDIVKHMNWNISAKLHDAVRIVDLFGRERDVYELLSNEPVHFDQLTEKTGMTAGELSSTLTMLELAGVVERIPGDWYVRC